MSEIPYYLNVDSRFIPRNNLKYGEKIYYLAPNPLTFTSRSHIVKIQAENHSFYEGDIIALDNVIFQNKILVNPLSFKRMSQYLKIHHPQHGISLEGFYRQEDGEFTELNYVESLPTSFRENEVIPDGRRHYMLKRNVELEWRVKISNGKGFDYRKYFIGNLSMNYLNQSHQIYLIFRKDGSYYVADPDYYLIPLEHPADVNYQDGISYYYDKNGLLTTEKTTNTLYVSFLSIAGIPLHIINSGGENISHTVISRTDDSFEISLPLSASLSLEQEKFSFGGNNVFLREIQEEEKRSLPENFFLQLPEDYRQITSVRLINTIFPYPYQNIKKGKNRIYWKNLDDGPWTYYIEIRPGNYSPESLAREINLQFSNKIKYQYTVEYQNGIYQTIIEKNTPLYPNLFYYQGFNQYHQIEIQIDREKDLVIFYSYDERILTFLDNPVIQVPDNYIELSFSVSLRTNFGIDGTEYIKKIITPFHATEILWIYYTEETYLERHPYAYRQFYRYVYDIQTEPYRLAAVLETERAVLINFYRSTDDTRREGIHEFFSYNTSTLLNNFYYYSVESRVTLRNHQLKIADFILTDRFIETGQPQILQMYEIVKIIDAHNFQVEKIYQKIIYRNFLLNFSENYLFFNDKVKITEVYTSVRWNSFNANYLITVTHPIHLFRTNDEIIIQNATDINYLSAVYLNRRHRIIRILGENTYQIAIPPYPLLAIPAPYLISQAILIKYPSRIKLLFHYADSLNRILGFKPIDLPYLSVVSNTLPPNFTPQNYFYICCPELSTFDGQPPHVFAKIFLLDNPSINTFVPTIKFFPTPTKISSLTFSFISPEGEPLYQNLPYSFVLEFIGKKSN